MITSNSSKSSAVILSRESTSPVALQLSKAEARPGGHRPTAFARIRRSVKRDSLNRHAQKGMHSLPCTTACPPDCHVLLYVCAASSTALESSSLPEAWNLLMSSGGAALEGSFRIFADCESVYGQSDANHKGISSFRPSCRAYLELTHTVSSFSVCSNVYLGRCQLPHLIYVCDGSVLVRSKFVCCNAS